MVQPYVGEVRMFAGSFAPTGWLFCDGQLLPISEYETLFQLVGTTYGGDGQVTFALPDLRGRLPVHQGAGPGLSGILLGETGGRESVTLISSQLPVHTHPMGAVDAQPGNEVSPAGRLPSLSLNVVPYLNDPPGGSFDPAAVTLAGGSQPHENLHPYLCVNFIIAVYGVFPSQA